MSYLKGFIYCRRATCEQRNFCVKKPTFITNICSQFIDKNRAFIRQVVVIWYTMAHRDTTRIGLCPLRNAT